MKIVYFLFFILLSHVSNTFSSNVIGLRKLYYVATVNKDSADKFFNIMETLNVESNPLLLCYKGMANLIEANHSYNPYSKLAYFSKGKDMLEKSVKIDPQNIEIRFMRFCVQTNAPFFLGYSSQIENDKAVILKGWSGITDVDLKTKIKNYMIESKACTNIEKLILR